MSAKSLLLGAAMLTAPLVACVGKRSNTAIDPARESYVAVTNNHWLDVVVYAVRSNVRFRLGTVRGLSEGTLPLKRSVVGAGDNIQLLVAPIGSSRYHVTDYVSFGPDMWIDFKVQSPLNLSTLSIWPHGP